MTDAVRPPLILPPEAEPQDPAARRLVIAACLVAFVVCGVTGYWLWVLLDHRLQFTHRQVTLQTASVAEHASTVFRAVDIALLTTVADLKRGRIEPADAHASLQLRMGGNGSLVALSLIDAQGQVLASSWARPAPAVRIAASDGATQGLQVSAPAPNPFDGHPAIELSRQVVYGPEDSAGAAARLVSRVVATVDYRFVSGFFDRVAFAKDAQVGLFTLDGTRLAGSVDLAALAPGTPPAEELQELLVARPDGSTEHGQVFAATQRLQGLPMALVTLRSRQAALAPWREYVVSAGLATVAALVLLTLAVRRLQGEMRARLRAQAALARSREESRLTFEATQQRTRRLESLGRLSGGIAHDFNNILAAILGYGDLLQQEVGTDTAASRHLGHVLRAGERGRHLVARILSFSRGGARNPTPVSPDAVAGEALDQLASSTPANVAIARELGAAGALVLGDPSQLFEAINNLCTNALHAMPEGGTLAVRTATLRTDSPRTLSHGTLAAGRHVTIAVEDSGLGMSAEVVEHLFEPFFTTRATTGGTGLGLAMVHGAVKEMNGAIDVRSAPGQGARFVLCFPLAEAAVPGEPVPPTAAPRGHGQVVMVVDDEPALVGLTEEVLAGLGYEAVGFGDPRQALAVLQGAPMRFDALLTDQVMPGLAGTDLARQWHALRPDAPILLASGFGGPDLERQARDAGVTVVLQKPLHRGELATELARVLGTR